LPNDEALREELRLQLHLKEVLRREKEAQARELFTQINRGSASQPTALPFWQRPAVKVAATIFLFVMAGILLWATFFQPAPPIALPKPKGTPRSSPGERTRLLPLYETDGASLGFGTNTPPVDSIVAIFNQGAKAAYTFGDTLRVYLPQLPSADTQLQVYYDRQSDTYVLRVDRDRYSLEKTLRTSQELKKLP
jgi:hypothetical protein